MYHCVLQEKNWIITMCSGTCNVTYLHFRLKHYPLTVQKFFGVFTVIFKKLVVNQWIMAMLLQYLTEFYKFVKAIFWPLKNFDDIKDKTYQSSYIEKSFGKHGYIALSTKVLSLLSKSCLHSRDCNLISSFIYRSKYLHR